MTELPGSPKINASDGDFEGPRDLIATLLGGASELEHSLACMCLFAACTLKNSADERGLTDEQSTVVRGWKRSLIAATSERMAHLTQISAVLNAFGRAPSLRRPIFPTRLSTGAASLWLTLDPFSQQTVERLASLEATVLHEVYAGIETQLSKLPVHVLPVTSPMTQEKISLLGRDYPLVAVVDLVSARDAIKSLAGNAEAVIATEPGARANVFAAIADEYEALVPEVATAGGVFDPVRPVVRNPTVHQREQAAEGTLITSQPAVAVANLFNDAYDTMLLMLVGSFMPLKQGGIEYERLAQAIQRLSASVIRPLAEALTQLPVERDSLPGMCSGPTFGDGGASPLTVQASTETDFAERLWHLATTATNLRARSSLPTEIQEATAALQELACQFAPTDGPRSAASRLAELQEMETSLPRAIQASVNGPYLLTNVENLYTWLGERIPTRPQMALCRCGASGAKPFCDGSHARIEFTETKDPHRVPDRRDTYAGHQVTILDNRGICQHSGFCSDRLATVFRTQQDPFVAPSGGRMDEIIRAVRACPSGALSYAIDGAEAREHVDWGGKREAAVELSRDGPYRITGDILLLDGHGRDEARNQGASREHFALCRCGHSQNKPFCSGMHWYINFRDPEFAPDYEPTLFEWAGGLPALTRMTRIFYGKYVPQDPLLAPLFANMSPDHPERVAAWLGEVFGGPSNYTERYGGYARMISQHVGKGIDEAHRARWASLIIQSAEDAGLPADPEFRAAFVAYIEWGSRLAVENSTPGARPPQHMPVPRWWWVCNATPRARVSALAPQPDHEEKVVLPAADELLSFERHVKPLFRTQDRQSMKFAFDLWAYADVITHASAILQRLQNGSMPCDGAWPPERVTIFQRWVESGMPQ